MKRFIPFHRPSIGEEEALEVLEALQSGWITTGPRTAQFEREFADYVRAPHAQAVNSCTAALHVALDALGIGPGDEVITTPLTFCATVNTILQVGAKVVLADVDQTGNIDPASVRDRITSATRAIVPVHLGGLPCRMDEIWDIARQYDLKVVEDAAHAIGTHYHGQPIGSTEVPSRHSDAVAFSFYATKNLTTGEGGMLTMASKELADKCKVLCLHGISKDAWNRYSERGNWRYDVVDCGYKYNLSDLQSAIGIHQLRKQELFIGVRRKYAQRYCELLQDLEELELPPDDPGARHVWHLFGVRLRLENLNIDRSEFIELLRGEGIGASVHFIPIPTFSYYAQHSRVDTGDCHTALQLFPRLVSLPLYPAMKESEVEFVAERVRKIVHQASRRCFAAAV